MKTPMWSEAIDAYGAWLRQSMAYECLYCNVQFLADDDLFQHVEGVHKVGREKYSEDNPHFSTQATKIDYCRICGRQIQRIQSHLEGEHKIASELYFMRFVFCPKSFDPAIGFERPYEGCSRAHDDKTIDGGGHLRGAGGEKLHRSTSARAKKAKGVDGNAAAIRPSPIKRSRVKRNKRIKLKTEEEEPPPLISEEVTESIIIVFEDGKTIDLSQGTVVEEVKATPPPPPPATQESSPPESPQESHLPPEPPKEENPEPASSSSSSSRSFRCKYCPKEFQRNSCLLRHTKIHTGEKTHQCQFCGKSFSQSCSLVKHTRIHTGEMPYTCWFCDKRFRNNSNFARHIRKHRQAGDKPLPEEAGNKPLPEEAGDKSLPEEAGDKPLPEEAS